MQRKKQKEFIMMVTGGPNNYSGLDMKKAHEKMMISKESFNITWNHLQRALRDFNVGKNCVD